MNRSLKDALLLAGTPARPGVFLLVLIAVVLVSGQGFAAETRKLTVIQETAPLFKERSIRSPIIKYLEKGSELNLLAVEDSFYLVSYGGYEGWVIPYSVEGDLEGLQDEQAAEEDSTPGSAIEISDQELASGRYLVVTNRYANIREGPGLNYKRIGRVYKGDKLEKFIKRGRWYRVRLPDSKIGFVREDLVADPSTESENLAAEPEMVKPVGPLDSLDQIIVLKQKVERLEQEVVELRKLLNDHIRETRALLVEMQRSKSTLVPPGLMEGAPGRLDLTNPASIQSESVKGKIIGNTATRIYHLPESIFYDKIPEELRVYFDSEEQARKAGYIKSIK